MGSITVTIAMFAITITAIIVGRRGVIGRGLGVIGGRRRHRRRLDHDRWWRRIIGMTIIIVIVTPGDSDRDSPEKYGNQEAT
jgi:hypothetical protein